MSRPFTHALALVLALAVLSPLQARAAPSQVEPLAGEQRALFLGSPEDQVPEKLHATREDLEGRHYLAGDERALNSFEPHVKGLGGGLAGVGTDQIYVLAGWSRPELVWLTDYDPWVGWLHQAYMVFFREAENRKEFRAFWLKENRRKAVKLLRARLVGHPDLKMIVRVYRRAQGRVTWRLSRLHHRLKKAKTPSFITDDETYEFVRELVRAGRVRPMLCNLLDSRCMVGLGDAARKLGVPLRVLYLSNAEHYWSYSEQFRQNIYAQHFDSRSVVLRTDASKKTNGDYCYNVQTFTSFVAWLKQDWVTRVRQIAPRPRVKDEEHIPVTVIDRLPTPADRPVEQP